MMSRELYFLTTTILASLVCAGSPHDIDFRRPGPHQPGWPPRHGLSGSGDCGVEIEFCSGSTYAASEVCPANDPVAGAGTCGNFTVKPNVCCKNQLVLGSSVKKISHQLLT